MPPVQSPIPRPSPKLAAPPFRGKFSEAAFRGALETWIRKLGTSTGRPPAKISHVLDCAHRSDPEVRMMAKRLVARRIADSLAPAPDARARLSHAPASFPSDSPHERWLWASHGIVSRSLLAAGEGWDSWIRLLALSFARERAAAARAPSDPPSGPPRRRANMIACALDASFPLHDDPDFNDLFAACLSSHFRSPTAEGLASLREAGAALAGSFDPAQSLGECLPRIFCDSRDWTCGFEGKHDEMFQEGGPLCGFPSSSPLAGAEEDFWARLAASCRVVSQSAGASFSPKLTRAARKLAAFTAGSPAQGRRLASLLAPAAELRMDCAGPASFGPQFPMDLMLACKGLPCAAEVARAARPAYEPFQSPLWLARTREEADSMALALDLQSATRAAPAASPPRL